MHSWNQNHDTWHCVVWKCTHSTVGEFKGTSESPLTEFVNVTLFVWYTARGGGEQTKGISFWTHFQNHVGIVELRLKHPRVSTLANLLGRPDGEIRWTDPAFEAVCVRLRKTKVIAHRSCIAHRQIRENTSNNLELYSYFSEKDKQQVNISQLRRKRIVRLSPYEFWIFTKVPAFSVRVMLWAQLLNQLGQIGQQVWLVVHDCK